MTQMPSTTADFSPASLRYTAALRGVPAQDPETSFGYAMTGSFNPELLTNLAASNPEGHFFGVVANNELRETLTSASREAEQSNLFWLASLEELPEALAFFCFFAPDNRPSDELCEQVFDRAKNLLGPNGILAMRYRAYEDADEILRYLANEYAPEFSENEESALLDQLAAIGTLYFSDNPDQLELLRKAQASGETGAYLDRLTDQGEASSGAFNTLAALLPRGFAYGGDANIGANYLELAAPQEAHKALMNCKSSLMYETLKDFALQRLVRNDLWIKMPVEQVFDKPSLFGPFVFGMTVKRSELPEIITASGGNRILLNEPPFKNLLNLMELLPCGIGDFLQHEEGQGQDPDDVLSALQILIASGIVQPMRSRCSQQISKIDFANPKTSTATATALKTNQIDAPTLPVASAVTGRPICMDAKEALVLQAISRVGLPQSVASVYQELQRLSANNPSLAQQILASEQPSPETAQKMVQTVLGSSLLKWYAYGLLAA